MSDGCGLRVLGVLATGPLLSGSPLEMASISAGLVALSCV